MFIFFICKSINNNLIISVDSFLTIEFIDRFIYNRVPRNWHNFVWI